MKVTVELREDTFGEIMKKFPKNITEEVLDMIEDVLDNYANSEFLVEDVVDRYCE